MWAKILLALIVLVSFSVAEQNSTYIYGNMIFNCTGALCTFPPVILPGGGGGGGAISFCGDGVCFTSFENYTSCPKDCKKPIIPTVAPALNLEQKAFITVVQIIFFLLILAIIAFGKWQGRNILEKVKKIKLDKDRYIAAIKRQKEFEVEVDANMIMKNKDAKEAMGNNKH